MKSLGMTPIVALLLLTSVARAESYALQLTTAEPVGQSLPESLTQGQPQIAMVCFFDSETTSGMNKICYYNCLGSLAAITLGFTEICPMSINR